jgi:hypothetical protein
LCAGQKSLDTSLRALGREAEQNVSHRDNRFGFALQSSHPKVRLHVLLQSVGRLGREIVTSQSAGLKLSLRVQSGSQLERTRSLSESSSGRYLYSIGNEACETSVDIVKSSPTLAAKSSRRLLDDDFGGQREKACSFAWTSIMANGSFNVMKLFDSSHGRHPAGFGTPATVRSRSRQVLMESADDEIQNSDNSSGLARICFEMSTFSRAFCLTSWP